MPNNHTPPDDDIERNLCVELFVVVDLAHFLLLLYLVYTVLCTAVLYFSFVDLDLRFLSLRVHWTSFHSHTSCELFCFLLFRVSTDGHLDVKISSWRAVPLTTAYFVFLHFFCFLVLVWDVDFSQQNSGVKFEKTPFDFLLRTYVTRVTFSMNLSSGYNLPFMNQVPQPARMYHGTAWVLSWSISCVMNRRRIITI